MKPPPHLDFIVVCNIHPSSFYLHPYFCGVAKLVRHRIVNAAIEGSNPSATAKTIGPELEWQSNGLLSRNVRVQVPSGQPNFGVRRQAWRTPKSRCRSTVEPSIDNRAMLVQLLPPRPILVSSFVSSLQF